MISLLTHHLCIPLYLFYLEYPIILQEYLIYIIFFFIKLIIYKSYIY